MMLAESQREVLLERRNYTPEQATLWGKLSLAQKFAVSSLNQYGYQLVFIRGNDVSSSAILLCSDVCATVSSDGDIDTSPTITIRH